MNRSTRTSIIVGSLLLLVFMLGAGLAIGTSRQALAAGPVQTDIRGFHLLSAGEGWLWTGPQLYWTRDAGAHWSDITAPNFERAAIRAVYFNDPQHGWLVAVRPASGELSASAWQALSSPQRSADGGELSSSALRASSPSQRSADGGELSSTSGAPVWVLAYTPDAGRSWQIRPLPLFDAAEALQMSGLAALDFVNPQVGWLSVQRMTSSAFSAGVLFRTTDGGQTWQRVASPGGRPVYFVTPDLGWTTAGPLGDHLYRTSDGGLSWTRQSVAAPRSGSGRTVRYQLPVFENARAGVLPVLVSGDAAARVAYYLTADGGKAWRPAVSVPVDPGLAGALRLPLSVLNARRWLQATSAGGGRMLDIADGQVVTARGNSDGRAASIVALDMTTPAIGWAEQRSGDCAPLDGGQRLCSRQSALLRTVDGGQSWQPLALPGALGTSSAQAPAGTKLVASQGFDACTPGSLPQMQTWFATSPYTVVNLYLGGSELYSGCTVLTPSYVTALAAQGWTFIPTWIGPQAPCAGYKSSFPYDPTQAQAQGVAEADSAINRAAALGLTLPDQSSTILYYDMEYFDTSNNACRDAAKAFISGWTGELRARNNKAGVYAISSIMSDYSAISNVPDDVWMAQWTIPAAYSPTASVWNVPFVSNSVWVNHQRLHQYAGGHDETWGGVTLNIDSDVLDARVAALPCYVVSLGVNVPAGGSLGSHSGTSCPGGFLANSVLGLQATPSAGYLFTGWGGDAAGLSNPLTVTVNSNLSFIAAFSPIQSRILLPLIQASH